MLCVHSWHHTQSLARKIQVGRLVFLSELAIYLFSVINFLANKNKAWATLFPTVSTTENNCLFCLAICHHLRGYFSSYLMLVCSW